MLSISRAFRCFDEVAQRGSVRKAAETLHLTPAAVHQQVTNLEAQVGVPLFDRVPRGMQLSAAGEILLAAVRRSQRDVNSAMAQLDSMRSLRRGHVSIGVSESSAESVIAAVVERSAETYPGIDYRVRTGHGETIVKWVASGEVDFGYCLTRAAPAGVAQVKSWRQRLGVVVAATHPLAARKRAPPLHACIDFPLVLATPEMELRTWVDRIARQAGRELKPFVETSSVSMLRRLVRTSGCVGFAIAENVGDDVASGQLAWLPLADAEAHSATCLFQRQSRTRAAAAGVFVQFLDEAVSALAAGPSAQANSGKVDR